MTKHDIVTKIARETGLSQAEARKVLQHLLDEIIAQLAAGNSVTLRNFGAFAVKQRKPRIGRNPNAPDADVEIPPRPVVKFKPSRMFQDRVRDRGIEQTSSKPANDGTTS